MSNTPHTTKGTEYERLLEALEMPSDGHTSFLLVAKRLAVSPAQLSDCLRRGRINETVLTAACQTGINPDFVRKGLLPQRLS